MDVGEDTSLRDGDSAEELVQLLVVADGELDVSRDDPAPLVVLGGVAGQLEELGGEVDGGPSQELPPRDTPPPLPTILCPASFEPYHRAVFEQLSL